VALGDEFHKRQARGKTYLRRGKPFPHEGFRGHHNGLMPSAPTTTEIVRETRHGLVVKMRLEGHTHQAISDRLGLSVSQCHRIYQAARARRRGDYDIQRHIDEQYADIEGALELLRPFVLGIPGPPDMPVLEVREAHDFFWKARGAKSKLLGLDAPKRTHVMSEDVHVIEENHPAAEKLARLAAWARVTNAINVDGYNPALPPGMSERPVAVESNGHGKVHGSSMWSLAVEFPSDD
jgi:hypothetical protein